MTVIANPNSASPLASPPFSEPKGNEIAGAVRGSAGMPLVAQYPLAGNGVHPVSSSALTGCAPDFAGERAEADASRLSAALAEHPKSSSQAIAPTAMTSPAVQHQEAIVLDLDLNDLTNIVNRVLAADRVIERISQVCPQGEECAGPAMNKDGCRLYQ